jgi:hypothetical protein
LVGRRHYLALAFGSFFQGAPDDLQQLVRVAGFGQKIVAVFEYQILAYTLRAIARGVNDCEIIFLPLEFVAQIRPEIPPGMTMSVRSRLISSPCSAQTDNASSPEPAS